MKKLITTSIIAVLAVIGSTIMAQDEPDEYLGLPGDNLNLYAVMDLFQKSETLEGFERSLNDENNRINNLDLNGDNLIDYIKVVDYVDGEVHTIVLQAVLGRKESQDVAVFTVQRLRDGSVQIQLTGDELLYGRNYIIEPIYAETPNPGYTGRRDNVTVVRTTYVEVATWPVVRFIFLPNYVIWRSSWYWGYYPHYWNPWRPYYWHYYYGYHYHWYPDYYSHFHRYDHHRYDRWNDFYFHNKRAYSHNVHKRIDAGDYRVTYSRPEQRRDGEALYSKVHPERQATTSSGNNVNRRSSGPEAGSTRQSSGNASTTTRRSSTTVTERSNTDRAAGGTTRRSSTTATERKESNPSAGSSSSTTRRTTTTATERKTTSTPSGQAAGTSRRSTTTVSEKTVRRPETAPRAASSRTSKQSTATGSSSGRRNSGTSKSESKPTSSRKDSESSTNSRRK
jgi:hypothetical protein